MLDIMNYDQIRPLEEMLMKHPQLSREITFKGNWICIITNGTAILGFGDIGA